jgi:hypothetical protein
MSVHRALSFSTCSRLARIIPGNVESAAVFAATGGGNFAAAFSAFHFRTVTQFSQPHSGMGERCGFRAFSRPMPDVRLVTLSGSMNLSGHQDRAAFAEDDGLDGRRDRRRQCGRGQCHGCRYRPQRSGSLEPVEYGLHGAGESGG